MELPSPQCQSFPTLYSQIKGKPDILSSRVLWLQKHSQSIEWIFLGVQRLSPYPLLKEISVEKVTRCTLVSQDKNPNRTAHSSIFDGWRRITEDKELPRVNTHHLQQQSASWICFHAGCIPIAPTPHLEGQCKPSAIKCHEVLH